MTFSLQIKNFSKIHYLFHTIKYKGNLIWKTKYVNNKKMIYILGKNIYYAHVAIIATLCFVRIIPYETMLQTCR